MQMALDLDACMDEALSVRVNVAITNNQWALAAQPLYFDEAAASLEEARAALNAAEAQQQDALQIARAQGWI